MKLFHFLLLLCLPSFLLVPIPSYAFERITYPLETGHKLFIPRDKNGLINPWGYFNPQTILTHLDGYADHVFGFIDLLSDVDFLESLSDEEAERLIDFVIFIVRFSVPKSRSDLAEKYEHEIAELLELMYGEEEEYQLLSDHGSHWDFSPAICQEKPEFTLCKKKKKGWVKRKWHHFTHWCDKNKEPLIAFGVVAGVATIAALTGGFGAGATAAVGGALAGATAMDDSHHQINKPGEVYFHDYSQDYPPQNNATTTLPSRDFHLPTSTTPAPEPTQSLEEMPLVVQQSIEDTKEEFTKEPAKQKPKEFISHMGHQILDELSTYGLEHVIGEEAIDAGHEIIDRAFGTDYAADYTTEMKEQIAALKDDFELNMAIGELPPPTISAGAVAKTGTAIGSALVAQEALSGASAVGGTLAKADPNPSQMIDTPPQLQLEGQIRNDLLAKGYDVPPRPGGVPENWSVEPSKKGGGVKYTLEVTKKNGDPYNKEEVRVMPANPNSPNEGQRRPYVKHRIESSFYDKDGNIVPEDSLEAHIEYDKYDFKKISNKIQKG